MSSAQSGVTPQPARAETGVSIGICAIAMCFAALSSAMVVRQGASGEWLHFEMPRLLWAGTALLLASLVSIHLVQRQRGKIGLLITAALGAMFLGCVLMAWQELAAQGVLLATSGSASFFYVFTAACGLCVAGGILTMLWGLVKPVHMKALGTYWHFVAALWIFSLLLMKWRI
jgi:cytochrome c oxidase subunit III